MHVRILINLLYFIIFFTGAAGLIYEVTWQKYISRLLGSDTIATAVILAVFLGGLSLGYYLCGRISMRIKNHFKAYAVMEGIIGAWCLFFPKLFQTVDAFTRSWSFSAPMLLIMQGVACSIILMGIPTICMGSTIPFLTRGISRNLAEATNVHARVYAINTAGAFLGTLIAGFYLIPEFGLPLTMIGTAFLNLGAFGSIYILQKWLYVETDEKTQTIIEDKSLMPKLEEFTTSLISPRILYIIAFLSGFYVMTLENVFIRIINLTLGSSSYSFSLIVSVFILAIALGSYRIGRRKQIASNFLFKNQLAITLSLLLIYMTLDTWPYWAHVVRISIQSHIIGFWLFYLLVFLILILLLVVPAGLMGATVPIAFHEIKRDLKRVGKHSGYLFSLNTIGNLTGSLIGGIVFYYFFNNGRVFLIALLLAGTSTYLAGMHLSKRYKLSSLIVGIVVLALFLSGSFYHERNFSSGTFLFRSPIAASSAGPTGFFKEFFMKSTSKFYKDGPTGTVAVISTSSFTDENGREGMSIFVNGKSDSNTVSDGPTLKLSAHIPALLATDRKKVLVIGLGTGVTTGEFTLYPDIACIDVAEISPTVIEALPLFSDFTHDVHKNPKVHLHVADAFRFLGRGKIKYDIIVSEPSNPWVTGVDLLFTKEFYQMVNNHLTDQGAFLQWVQFYSASKEMVGMVLNTVQHSFKYCHVFLAAYGDLLILASNHDISKQDLEKAEQTFRENAEIQKSLQQLHIENFESILIREIWPTSYLKDEFQNSGLQTMDNPRLHYLAGRNVFMGMNLPQNYMYNSKTARFSNEYLLPKLYPDWNAFPFSREVYDSMLKSLFLQKAFIPPSINSLKIKAALDPASGIKLSEEEKKSLGIDLISFIEKYPANGITCQKLGFEKLSMRDRFKTLIAQINLSRDWINPFPLDGLKKLLQEEIMESQENTEKNWCSLQLIMLSIVEDRDLVTAKRIFDNLIKDNNQKIILENDDAFLLELVKDKLQN